LIESKADRQWDIPVRVFHWVIAIAIVVNLFVVDESEDIHEWVGYVAAGTVALRLLWGKFVRRKSPRKEHRFLPFLIYAGLWLLVLSLGVTGWMLSLDVFWGEAWVEDLHGKLSIALQVSIVLHLLGIIFVSIRYRRHTWLNMVTGRRK